MPAAVENSVAVADHFGYCDFDVAVSRAGDDFEVRVLGSPAGETSAIRVAGVAPAARTAEHCFPRGPDRDVGVATARTTDREQVGHELFDLLFPGEALVRFRESQRKAAAQDRGLRIVLRAGTGADRLPWELLRDPSSRRFLALDPRSPVVRCIEMPDPGAVPALDGPLRILVAVATPAGSTTIDAARELDDLRTSLRPLVAAGVLEIVSLPDASLDGIRDAAAGGDIHVLHYIGHGSRAADGRGLVELVGADGSASPRTGDDLGVVLAAAPALRLVVLNCCHGASSADDDPFAGAAASLVRGGVPAVLAMRHTIGDRSAIELCRAFYAELVSGARVEGALAAGRQALFVRDDPSADDWPTAALYLGSSMDVSVTASPLPPIDEDVQFTVACPAQLRATRWESMLVFGHRSGPYASTTGAAVDPHAEIQERVARFFGSEAAGVVSGLVDAASGVPRGAGLVVVPDLPDVECSPAHVSMRWTGELEEASFLLRAGAHREGSSLGGWVRVFCGPLMIAEAAVEFAVVGNATAPAPLREQVTIPYRRIFPCFSPEDIELVSSVAAVAAALGDRFATGVLADRPDDAPDGWLLPLIEEADVFQLFWSSNSMKSSSCRRQWEAAVATDRAGFIRPLYWEHPFPRAPGLPPPSLEGLRFIRVPSWTAPAGVTTELWRGTPPAQGAGQSPSSAQPDPGGPRVAAPPPPARSTKVSSGAVGLASVVGLVAAAVAALVTATLPGGGMNPVPTTSPDVNPPLPPTGDGGSSILVSLAVGVGVFVLAFAITLLVVRRRRRR
jgi:hypothetical protein